MRSHALAKILLENDDCEITCSVDISTCDADADRRVFGDLVEINSLPTNEGFGSSEVVLLFVGSISQ